MIRVQSYFYFVIILHTLRKRCCLRMSFLHGARLWGPRIIVGACGMATVNDYIVSFCVLPEGVYAVNKICLIGDSWMDNISNGVQVVCW